MKKKEKKRKKEKIELNRYLIYMKKKKYSMDWLRDVILIKFGVFLMIFPALLFCLF